MEPTRLLTRHQGSTHKQPADSGRVPTAFDAATERVVGEHEREDLDEVEAVHHAERDESEHRVEERKKAWA